MTEPDALARPSIKPGTSATVSCRVPSGASTVPRIGASVVNGYSATFGFAFEMRASSDDLPAFGQPDERGVGKQLEPEVERRFLTGQARSPRTAAPGVSAMRSACCRGRGLPHARGNHRAPGVGEIRDQLLVLVEHLRSDGDP